MIQTVVTDGNTEIANDRSSRYAIYHIVAPVGMKNINAGNIITQTNSPNLVIFSINGEAHGGILS